MHRGTDAPVPTMAAQGRPEDFGMQHDVNHFSVFAKPETLGDDFALLFEAIADAFRGMSATSQLESHWSRQRYCAENC